MSKHPPFISLAVLILGIGACSTQPAMDATPNGVAVAAPAGSAVDLTVTSTPAAGSTVNGPVNQIILDFSVPVALGEVLVTGPDGVMPMMVGSAGLQTHYSIPVSGLMSGSYTLAWKATLDGQPKSGSFAFTIK